MRNKTVTQMTVVSQTTPNTKQVIEEIALFDSSGAAAAVGPSPVAVTTGSAIGTVGKTTTHAAPAAGQLVAVTFTNGNSATSPTLAFNGGSAKPMLLGGTASAAAKLAIAAGGVALFLYDGTSLHQVGAYT